MNFLENRRDVGAGLIMSTSRSISQAASTEIPVRQSIFERGGCRLEPRKRAPTTRQSIFRDPEIMENALVPRDRLGPVGILSRPRRRGPVDGRFAGRRVRARDAGRPCPDDANGRRRAGTASVVESFRVNHAAADECRRDCEAGLAVLPRRSSDLGTDVRLGAGARSCLSL